LEFIADVEGVCRIHLRPFAGPEVNFRSRFLDPFLSADQDRVKEREYLKGIQCLDCAAKGKAIAEISISSLLPQFESMKDPDKNG